jgi:hypothetical protein
MEAASTWERLVHDYRAAAVPAPAIKAATLAQWMLGSSCGTSDLALRHNNFAALPYMDDLAGLASSLSWRPAESAGTYCAFDSPGDFMQGYWLFIQRPQFAGWQRFEDDPARFLDFLAEKGFSRDPFHAVRAKALLPEARALLEAGGTENRSRLRRSPLAFADLASGLDPEFRRAAEVSHVFRGARPCGLEGAVLRMDEAPRAPLYGGDDPAWGARQALKLGARNRLAFVAIDRSGVVHLPANHDFGLWGFHAGPGRCPRTGRQGTSRHLLGIEINGPGQVYPTADPDVFVPWYNAVATTIAGPSGETSVPTLDREGRARPIRTDWEVYRRAGLGRVASEAPGAPGTWHALMTSAQHEALVQLLLHLKRAYPASFRLDLVLGQDEIAPGDPAGPGPSLGRVEDGPMRAEDSMSRFRALLARRWAEEQAR